MPRVFILIQALFLTTGTVISSSALSLTLSEAITLAHNSDPTFLGAQASTAAAQERSAQAHATLRPQVSVTANTMLNHRAYDTGDQATPAVLESYESNNAQVKLTQIIWQQTSLIAAAQSDTASRQSAYQLQAAQQDMFLRLMQAWFDLMAARDNLAYVDQQLSTNEHQLNQLKRGNTVGLAAGPALAEAHARYGQALAERVAAASEQDIKITALEQILGPLPEYDPPFLVPTYPNPDLGEDSLDRCLNAIEENNPTVRAAQQALEAATQEVLKQRAGHEPTLQLVGTYGREMQDSGIFPGQSGFASRLSSVGLQLDWPLFASGAQNAKMREGVALRNKALQDFEAAKRAARAVCKQAWFGWKASRARYQAALQTMKFHRVTLRSAVTGKTMGIQTELETRHAREQMYGTLRDANKARYDMLLNGHRLRAATGQLTQETLITLEPWLNLKTDAEAFLADWEATLDQL